VVSIGWENRNPSIGTVARGAPGAVVGAAISFGGGVNRLVAAAARFVGWDGATDHFGEAADLSGRGANTLAQANFGASGLHPDDGEVFGRIGFDGGTVLLSELFVLTRGARLPDVAFAPTTWNEFQSATAGLYGSRAEAGAGWAYYQAHYGLGAVGGGADGVAQVHHLLSLRVMSALDDHSTLAGQFRRNDPRLIYQAADAAAHNGYQRWHIAYDNQVRDWLGRNPHATPDQFVRELQRIHDTTEAGVRIPGTDLLSSFGLSP
jgi:hypothetical protein